MCRKVLQQFKKNFWWGLNRLLAFAFISMGKDDLKQHKSLRLFKKNKHSGTLKYNSWQLAFSTRRRRTVSIRHSLLAHFCCLLVETCSKVREDTFQSKKKNAILWVGFSSGGLQSWSFQEVYRERRDIRRAVRANELDFAWDLAFCSSRCCVR